MASLTLHNLTAALESYGSTYDAIDVFADDLVELERLQAGATVPELMALDNTGTKFRATIDGRNYVLDLQNDGVARLSRNSGDSGSASTVLGATVGAAVGHAISKKGDGWLPGLILGMLVGSAMGQRQKRVFTLQFDTASGRWMAYDGGLVPWLKNQFLAAS